VLAVTDAEEQLGRLVQEEGHKAAKGVRLLGRVGLVSYGVVHLLIAWLVLQVALGGSNQQTDQPGAIAAIAAQPLGKALLGVITLGTMAFAAWQFVEAAAGHRWRSGSDQIRRRLGAVGKAIGVLVIGAVAVRFLFSGGSPSGNSVAQSGTARLLALPAGKVLVGLLALTILVIAGQMIYTGVRRTFLQDLDLGALSARARRATEWTGVVGHIAKGLAVAIAGVLIAVAGFSSDPSRAGGLDAVLHSLAGQPLGVVLLAVMALGFAAFGVYCFADARARRI
jgi:Domain of Unknown Function (DUF1206)